MYKTGVIHGRFQVLHNDHLKYLRAGYDACEHLVIGITNPDPVLTRTDAADPKRSTAANNPLTYYERHVMLTEALSREGWARDTFTVVPLPINMPQLYGSYVPLDAVFFLTIYDDWGRRKKRTFEQLGLKTHVLWERSQQKKGISASEIRQRIAQGLPIDGLVPACVIPMLERWNIRDRLIGLGAMPQEHNSHSAAG